MAMTMTMMNACKWYSSLLLLVQSFKWGGEGKRDGRSVFSGEIEIEVYSVCQSICRGGMLVGWVGWVSKPGGLLAFYRICVLCLDMGGTEWREGNDTRQTLGFSRLFAGIHLLGGARGHR
jgi:hypothetical protein